MRINELITKLRIIEETHGNLEVLLETPTDEVNADDVEFLTAPDGTPFCMITGGDK